MPESPTHTLAISVLESFLDIMRLQERELASVSDSAERIAQLQLNRAELDQSLKLLRNPPPPETQP